MLMGNIQIMHLKTWKNIKKKPSIRRDRENAKYLLVYSFRQTFEGLCEDHSWDGTLISKVTGHGLWDGYTYRWEQPRNFKNLLDRMNQLDFQLYKRSIINEIWVC